MKTFFAMYKAARGSMKRRTVLADDAGVLWEGAEGNRSRKAVSGDMHKILEKAGKG
jgi:hypothetical protein